MKHYYKVNDEKELREIVRLLESTDQEIINLWEKVDFEDCNLPTFIGRGEHYKHLRECVEADFTTEGMTLSTIEELRMRKRGERVSKRQYTDFGADEPGTWIGLSELGKAEDPKQVAGSIKTPLHLIPTVASEQMALALGCGEVVYGRYNWRESDGIYATTYIGAIKRHIDQYLDGEDMDEESKASHLGCAMAGCAILLDAARVGNLIDDRPKIGENNDK